MLRDSLRPYAACVGLFPSFFFSSLTKTCVCCEGISGNSCFFYAVKSTSMKRPLIFATADSPGLSHARVERCHCPCGTAEVHAPLVWVFTSLRDRVTLKSGSSRWPFRFVHASLESMADTHFLPNRAPWRAELWQRTVCRMPNSGSETADTNQ